MQTVFITGGTGYIGSRLIKALLQQGNYSVRALVRERSENKLPAGCEIVLGNALDAASYQQQIVPATIFVHLIGVAHPSPAKKEQFKKIDWVSVQQAAKAAGYAGIQHFVYLSVSMYPTNIMRDFQQVRADGEAILSQQSFISSFIRPWYVLGPGHWWPLLLKPLFVIMKLIPSKKQAAIHLDTVTIQQMINALVDCIDHPPATNTIVDVPKIKSY